MLTTRPLVGSMPKVSISSLKYLVRIEPSRSPAGKKSVTSMGSLGSSSHRARAA